MHLIGQQPYFEQAYLEMSYLLEQFYSKEGDVVCVIDRICDISQPDSYLKNPLHKIPDIINKSSWHKYLHALEYKASGIQSEIDPYRDVNKSSSPSEKQQQAPSVFLWSFRKGEYMFHYDQYNDENFDTHLAFYEGVNLVYYPKFKGIVFPTPNIPQQFMNSEILRNNKVLYNRLNILMTKDPQKQLFVYTYIKNSQCLTFQK